MSAGKTVKKTGKGGQAQQLLLEFILEEGLRPGDRLPPEEMLAVKFGVSRVSVREALHGLKFMGLLFSAPRRGTTLAEVDFSRLSRYLSFQLAYSAMSVQELLEARMAIEQGMLELLCEKCTGDTYLHLREAAEKCSCRDDSPAEQRRHWEKDFAFHRLLLSSGGNAVLDAFSSLLETFFRRLKGNSVTMAEIRRADAEHFQIVEAMHDKNIDLARRLLRRHLVGRYSTQK